MSARYGIGRLANSNELPSMQRKLENLYDNYNVRDVRFYLIIFLFTILNQLSVFFF